MFCSNQRSEKEWPTKELSLTKYGYRVSSLSMKDYAAKEGGFQKARDPKMVNRVTGDKKV